jgi:hypothetical protein
MFPDRWQNQALRGAGLVNGHVERRPRMQEKLAHSTGSNFRCNYESDRRKPGLALPAWLVMRAGTLIAGLGEVNLVYKRTEQ